MFIYIYILSTVTHAQCAWAAVLNRIIDRTKKNIEALVLYKLKHFVPRMKNSISRNRRDLPTPPNASSHTNAHTDTPLAEHVNNRHQSKHVHTYLFYLWILDLETLLSVECVHCLIQKDTQRTHHERPSRCFWSQVRCVVENGGTTDEVDGEADDGDHGWRDEVWYKLS